MKTWGALFFLLTAIAGCRPASEAQNSNTQTERGAAQVKFHAAVAKAYGARRENIAIHFQDLGIAETAFSSRQLSPVFAFRADFKDRALVVHGCNTAAPGDPAFVKQPAGIAPLMRAANILDPKTSLPLPDLIRLVAWIYHDLGVPAAAPAAVLERSAHGVTFSYSTRPAPEKESSWSNKVTVRVQPDYTTTVTSERSN